MYMHIIISKDRLKLTQYIIDLSFHNLYYWFIIILTSIIDLIATHIPVSFSESNVSNVTLHRISVIHV